MEAPVRKMRGSPSDGTAPMLSLVWLSRKEISSAFFSCQPLPTENHITTVEEPAVLVAKNFIFLFTVRMRHNNTMMCPVRWTTTSSTFALVPYVHRQVLTSATKIASELP
eukprot:scaffold3337_cov169-Amphora_coffeaeformis.AAC.28